METSLLEDVDRDHKNNDSNSDSNAVDDLGTSEIQHEEPISIPEASRIERRRFSAAILICISHALSAWGDRMWQFAVPILLYSLTPGSLRLTAIYGICVSLSVVTFGTLVGNWIDATPRLKAARLSLIMQNIAVVCCAVVFLPLLTLDTSKALFGFLTFVLILLGIVARLASLGTTIAIERDWVVVIAKEDKALMAGTNARLRRIDLTCNILAPITTGVVLNVGSNIIGIFFIAGWNVSSLFVEYYILTSVYASCPALADKTVDSRRHDGVFNDKGSDGDDNFRSLDLEEDSTDGMILVPRVNTVRSFRSIGKHLVQNIKSRARTLHFGFKLYFQQKIAFAGVGLACLYLTVLGFDSITATYAYSQHLSPFVLGVLTAAGALTGIIGTFIFPIFRKIFGVVRTGVVSLSIQLFFLMFCVASVWAPGHPGHLLDPFRHHKSPTAGNTTVLPTTVATMSPKRLDNTYTVAFSRYKVNPSISNSIVRPTAAIYPSPSSYGAATVINMSSNVGNTSIFSVTTHLIEVSSRSSAFYTTSMNATVSAIDNASNTSRNSRNVSSSSSSDDTGPSSYISLGLLMTGIVMSRTGLWMTDLVITQLFQENIAEQERGIVGGVQNSFNNAMDVAHFVLVTVAPKPEQFGALILVSVSMVALGFAFYTRFAWNFRKRLLQLEKLSQWSRSNESVEGTSRRLRQESRSNSQEELMKGMLTVENENYDS